MTSDSNGELLHTPLVGLKGVIGDTLMKLQKDDEINVYGVGYKIEGSGGQAGIWVSKIEIVGK